MNRVIYILFVAVTLSGFLSSHVHRYFTLVPEMLSIVVFALVMLRGGRQAYLCVTPKYVVLALIMGLHLFSGMIINMVSPGTIAVGARAYFKWIPIFLLPMVCCFSSEELARQMKLVAYLLFLQAPVAVFQRFVQYGGVTSGDPVAGSLGAGGSGALSILLLCAIAVLFSFFIRGTIGKGVFGVFLLGFFIPTVLNETKVTIVLVPISLVIPLIYSSWGRLKGLQMAGVGAIGAVLIAGYVPVYDYFMHSWGQPGIVDFVTDKDTTAKYLYGGAADEWTTEDALGKAKARELLRTTPRAVSTRELGRLDKVALPLRILADDPVRFWVGLGMGNVSHSFVEQFSGEYSKRIANISGSTLLSYLLWETGLGGVVLFLVFLYCVFLDARYLSRKNNIVGALSAGWVGVLAIMLVALPYLNMFFFNGLVYLFAYFSGYMVAERFRSQYSVGSSLNASSA